MEEVIRKAQEDLQAEEDKVNHANKVKAKLESALDEVGGEKEWLYLGRMYHIACTQVVH